MPGYVARRVQDLLNVDGKALRGSVVVLLGVTYKPNIADIRESPAVPLAKVLLQQGAVLRFHDPLVKQFSVLGWDVPRLDDVDASLGEADICVLLRITASMTWRRWLRSRGGFSTLVVWLSRRLTSNCCRWLRWCDGCACGDGWAGVMAGVWLGQAGSGRLGSGALVVGAGLRCW